jgi:hypothetical protein
MEFRVLDAGVKEERDAWLALWERWPGREVMAHPDYARLFAEGGARAVAAVGEERGRTVLLPLLLRPIAAEPWAPPGEEAWDAITPYGYGGPFTWGEGAAGEDVAFWRAYAGWCAEARVVSTFLRLSLFPGQLTSLPGDVHERGPNVVVPLGAGIEAVWDNYDRNVRRNVRKSRSSGVQVEVDVEGRRVAEFHAVYAHTMDRRGADAWYRFPLRFFETLARSLAGQCAFVHALVDGKVVASELALVSAENVYAFLGGTLQEAFSRFPNEAVRHATAEWAVSQGKRCYVLGGGYAPEDGILRHKRLFAPRSEVPFRVGCLLHDEVAAHRLARTRESVERARLGAWCPREGFFPVYRA